MLTHGFDCSLLLVHAVTVILIRPLPTTHQLSTENCGIWDEMTPLGPDRRTVHCIWPVICGHLCENSHVYKQLKGQLTDNVHS